LSAIIAGFLAFGCDIGEVDLRATGPALHVVESTPTDGEGITCDLADSACGVPLDRAIRLELDRPLIPASANRQSISVYAGTPGLGSPFLFPYYDVLARVLTYRLSGWLEPKTLYRLALPIAIDRRAAGLRAFDGAALAPGQVPTELSFFTSALPAASQPSPPFIEPTCEAVVQLLSEHCASGCCHGGEKPAMGLRLDSKAGLFSTAVGRVAHQTETGNTLGVTFENPARFGVAMPIIAPESAATSYLVYKMMLSDENLAPCSGADCGFDDLPGAQTCMPFSTQERERIAGWFVQGEPMPPERTPAESSGCGPPAGRPLNCGEMRALERFINSGVPCE
jgi:hypothetical protein